MGEVIAVLSGKGGTGKTSVCAGVAQALADAGLKVLCIDCDAGLRNLDISLGLADCGAISFQDILQGSYTLDEAACHPRFPTLSFLTAPVHLSANEVDADAFGRLIAEARTRFRFILLDAPAGVDAGFRLAARFADRVMLVAGADPACVRDAARAGELLELMGKHSVRLVVNRVNRKIADSLKITVDDLMDRTGLPLLGVVPEDSNVVLAAAFGVPLLRYTKKGAAGACKRIAKRILGISTPICVR